MKVCIVGAGAIGGLLGTRLALSGRCELSVLARGVTLAALQAHGWRLRLADQALSAPARACEHAQALGPQDLVIIAVKGHALPAVAAQLGPLLGPDTAVLPAMNGVPWWFCQGVSAVGAQPLASIDPGGTIARAVAAPRVLGCVLHVSAACTAPGVVAHQRGHGIIVGEPDGRLSERVRAVGDLLLQAGFEATLSTDIRKDIWYKLWGNLTMNPLSALTGATVDRLLDDPLVRTLCSDAMREAAEVGQHLGCDLAQSPDDRHAITRRLGAFKTSMLQDAQAGRPLELDAIVGVVHEIAQRLALPTPNIAAVLGLTRLFARGRGLYPRAVDEGAAAERHGG
jgi:2-dehydropantoate 2-reductase